jgi:heterotetrameric sarcosine oxidase gamma subunit
MGAVRYDAQGRSLLLHFAPGRWLAPDPIDETRSLLGAAALAGAGVVIEVTGKWDALLIRGPGATRLLACAIGIEAALDARDCAALTLFDCPVTLARVSQGFGVWVQSSYTADFLATAAHFQAELGNPP